MGLLVFILLMTGIASVIVWSGGEFRLSRRGEAVLWALGRTPSMPEYKDAGP